MPDINSRKSLIFHDGTNGRRETTYVALFYGEESTTIIRGRAATGRFLLSLVARLNTLNNQRDALTHADTHGAQGITPVDALQLI